MQKKYKKAVVFGTFDIVHPGHIYLFNYAKNLAEKLFVIIARDKNLEKETFFNEEQRLKNISKYKVVDCAYLGSLDNPLEFYKKLNPDLIILGYDQYKNVELLKNIKITTKRAPSYREELFKSQKIRNILSDQNANFFLIDKDKDKTSFSIISQLRKILNLKKVGFSGTLDPMASGLMIVASSHATKFLDAFHILNKVYKAKIEFGKISDSYDAKGIITKINVKKIPTINEIKNIIDKKFSGEILQAPPIFSAKKVNGKKMYEFARAGKNLDIKKEKITINNIKISKYKYPFLELIIDCSKGTYIRSIANDLGKILKTGAILVKLQRTKIGNFDLKNSTKQKILHKDNIDKVKINILEILDNINKAL
ncbi:MAG: tRNA pseudouridine(55) synthase TruB [Patescibacteria group bacterium]|nr:tRNA pseudouridine(55) synthase TruB [Patescibacteria group bacterium]MDD4303875.1 tRNA pseudouridine(55) synthase TruB [Patescibacteria group bacterium]MDD4695138.1 tRNA pseudouridine(55) synthase TruB [Patescibacteria group bacterium]